MQDAYVQKYMYECRELEAMGASVSGNALARVLVAATCPIEEKTETALRASFVALGYEADDWCSVYIPTGKACSTHADTSPEHIARYALSVFAPRVLVLIDEGAATLFAQAYMLAHKLIQGNVIEARGAYVLYIGDFPRALGAQDTKLRAWMDLQKLRYTTRFPR